MSIHNPSISYIIQTCSNISNNRLDSDSIHPDTYSLVGFSESLHLWWIPLLTNELLTPELCVTNVTMNQFPHAQG